MRVPSDLEAALIDLGVEPTKTDDDEVWAHCPDHLRLTGHEDSHASWSVNRENGVYNCFSCSSRGTFLDLAMRLKFPNNVFAASRWMRGFGSDISRDLPEYAARTISAPAEIVPETRLAMFNPVIPDWALDARQITQEACQHYNVRWNWQHEAWIIPVRYPGGSLAGWQEKWEKERRFINWPKGVGKAKCLFGLDVFPFGEPAVLLESPLDVLKLHTAGYLGGVSSYGAGVSRAQMQIIMGITDELVCALDDDASGRSHAEELRNGVWSRGKMVSPGYASRVNLRFFNYHNTGCKDIGKMEHSSIDRGLNMAMHSSTVDLANSEQRKERHELRGRSKTVPSPRSGEDGRAGNFPAERRRWRGKDDHVNSGGRVPRRGVR